MKIAFFGDSLTSGTPGSSYVAILRARFPEDTLLNFGKGNDTVVSLHRRISSMELGEPLDMVFLWIGVNDVTRADRWLYRAFHTLLGQRRARDSGEFETYFRAILDSLCDRAARVVVAPPALKGEDPDSLLNQRLRVLAGRVRDITAECAKAEFLDLQAVFCRELRPRPGSERVRKNPLGVLLDALTLRTDRQVDAAAAKRGLRLTIDGIHLNSAGAELVAEEFAAVIESYHARWGPA